MLEIYFHFIFDVDNIFERNFFRRVSIDLYVRYIYRFLFFTYLKLVLIVDDLYLSTCLYVYVFLCFIYIYVCVCIRIGAAIGNNLIFCIFYQRQYNSMIMNCEVIGKQFLYTILLLSIRIANVSLVYPILYIYHAGYALENFCILRPN